VEDSKF